MKLIKTIPCPNASSKRKKQNKIEIARYFIAFQIYTYWIKCVEYLSIYNSRVIVILFVNVINGRNTYWLIVGKNLSIYIEMYMTKEKLEKNTIDQKMIWKNPLNT